MVGVDDYPGSICSIPVGLLEISYEPFILSCYDLMITLIYVIRRQGNKMNQSQIPAIPQVSVCPSLSRHLSENEVRYRWLQIYHILELMKELIVQSRFIVKITIAASTFMIAYACHVRYAGSKRFKHLEEEISLLKPTGKPQVSGT